MSYQLCRGCFKLVQFLNTEDNLCYLCRHKKRVGGLGLYQDPHDTYYEVSLPPPKVSASSKHDNIIIYIYIEDSLQNMVFQVYLLDTPLHRVVVLLVILLLKTKILLRGQHMDGKCI
jgi:hypothetical protein